MGRSSTNTSGNSGARRGSGGSAASKSPRASTGEEDAADADVEADATVTATGISPHLALVQQPALACWKMNSGSGKRLHRAAMKREATSSS